MGRIEKETKFVFKQMIIWNKRFPEASNKGFLDGFVVVDGLRNYQQMCEYCLFYTFQDETGLSTVMLDVNNFPTLRRYFKGLLEFIGLNIKGLNAKIGHRHAEHCFYWNTTQWGLPTKETYNELIEKFNIKEWNGFKEYESLRQEYESLRQEYESLRYTFNNQKTHHSVWDYEIAPRVDHVTPKPLPLIENIIKHSSNEGDVVLDPFLGSGTTAVACKNLNRICIGIEKESKYIEIANKRLIE
jgi:site-specific DNA-methyltransferase (adenine-specific)